MGGPGSFLWFLIVVAAVVYPFWRILPRYGLPAWYALFAIIPLGAIVLLWVVAFREPDSGSGGPV